MYKRSRKQEPRRNNFIEIYISLMPSYRHDTVELENMNLITLIKMLLLITLLIIFYYILL